MSDSGTEWRTIGLGERETVIPPAPDDWQAELEEALALGDGAGRDAVAAVAAAHPRFLAAWAVLAQLEAEAGDWTVSYACARVGYHRGLDALRGAGWKGSGYVRWRHPSNRGFLGAVARLGAAAEAIGETEEADRCAAFLTDLDPESTEPA